MYKNILVATDGSKLSAKAVAHAIGLAQAVGAKLTAFYASPDYPMSAYASVVVYDSISPKEFSELCKKDAVRILDAIALKAKAAGLEFTVSQAIESAPWKAILAAAKKDSVTASSWRRTVGAAFRRYCLAAKRKRY